MFVTDLVNKLKIKEYEMPESIDIGLFVKIFENESINKELLKITHKILRSYFREYNIEEAVEDNLRGFVQNKIKRGSKYWSILERKVEQEIDDLEFETIYSELKNLILNED